MKKLLLTLMLCATVMATFAQSGWSDPSGSFQEQTVVYVTVDCGEFDIYSGVTNPQVAAFIDGEIRALVTSYRMLGDFKVYTLRVGGESIDKGKSIDFKLYDPVSGLIYPLEIANEDGEYTNVTYQGDYTYEENQSVMLFTGSAVPANEIRVSYYSSDYNSVLLNVGEKKALDEGAFVEYLFVNPTNASATKATTPEVDFKWDLSTYDNVGNQASYYISIEEGTNVITGNIATPYSVTAKLIVGNLIADVNVLVCQPITSIEIADSDIYLGIGRFVPEVIYNNGESFPSTPGVSLMVDNEDVVRIVDGTTIVPVALGSVTVTAVANDNKDVATKFQVNVISALEKFYYKGNIEFTIYDENSKDMTRYINQPIFNWAMDDSGAPVIEPNEEYTIMSKDPSIVSVEYDETGRFTVTAVKKGITALVFTSKYDAEKSFEVETVINQAVYDVNILTINGESVNGAETRPMADIYLNETVTVVAELNPQDADYDDFRIRFVTSDGVEIIGYEDWVEVIGTKIAEGKCISDFIFRMIPAEEIYIQAFVDGMMSDNVLLNVYNKVQSIDISMEPEYWIGSEENIFDFKYSVNPSGVKNNNLSVKSSAPDVAEVVKNLDTDIYQLHAYAPGEVTLTFISEDNPSVVETCVINIKRRVFEFFVDGLYEPLYNDGIEREVTVTFMPEDADFDIEALNVRVETTQFSFPGDWNVIEISDGEVVGNTVKYTFVGAALCQTADVIFEYDAVKVEGAAENITNNLIVSVAEKLTLNSGWNWISLTSSSLSVEELSKYLVEARSRTDLIFNDAKWGLFGSLLIMNQDEAFKVKIMEDIEPVTVVPAEGIMSYDGSIFEKNFIKGWNWVSYPYEYRYSVGEIFNAANFAEGDIILSKNNGFVTCTDGTWMGTLTELVPNEGYMIYTANEFTNKMPNRFSLAQGEFVSSMPQNISSREHSVWRYDGSKFANTMAVIAKVDIDNCDDYTVGAFVADECRGEGEFINGYAFISVAGDAGETVTFRLYNKISGKFIDLDSKLDYTNIAGSVNTPIVMGTIEGTTAIVDINTVDSNNIEAVYDLSGRKVENMTSGVYILKIREEGKVVTKKVRK